MCTHSSTWPHEYRGVVGCDMFSLTILETCSPTTTKLTAKIMGFFFLVERKLADSGFFFYNIKLQKAMNFCRVAV